MHLKHVFDTPLGPYPWSLGGPMDELNKTNKPALMHSLQKDTTS